MNIQPKLGGTVAINSSLEQTLDLDILVNCRINVHLTCGCIVIALMIWQVNV